MSDKILLQAIGEAVKKNVQSILQRDGFGAKINITIEVNEQEGSVSIIADSPHAMFLEYGTGLRGSMHFQSYFGEPKPTYTIPIKPVNAKVLHWVDKSGKDVFVAWTLGMKPVAFMRRGLFQSEDDIVNAFDKHFTEIELR